MTELDHTVLGVIWRDGPLSAYGVRKVFAASEAPTWSSSTGSIYPSIRRLVASGQVHAEERQGKRRMRQLSVTAEGRATLRAWFSGVTPELGAVPADPIRTRLYFVAALAPVEQRRFLAEALQRSGEAIDRVERRHGLLRTAGAKEEANAMLGALYALRARAAWLTVLTEEAGAAS